MEFHFVLKDEGFVPCKNIKEFMQQNDCDTGVIYFVQKNEWWKIIWDDEINNIKFDLKVNEDDPAVIYLEEYVNKYIGENNIDLEELRGEKVEGFYYIN